MVNLTFGVLEVPYTVVVAATALAQSFTLKFRLFCKAIEHGSLHFFQFVVDWVVLNNPRLFSKVKNR